MNTDNIHVQYITSKEGLKLALIDVLSEFNLIRQPDQQIKAPLTRQEACKFLNISSPTLGKLVKSGEIKTFYIGANVRISRDVLDRYIEIKNSQQM